jgi:hypothetical protein
MEMTMKIAANNLDDLLIFPDSWDTFFLGTKKEILDLGLEDAITLPVGKLCWPDPLRAKEYPETNSEWKYINSNPLIGVGLRLAKALEWGWSRFPLREDQAYVFEERFLTDLYFSRARKRFNIKLDTECRVTQLYEQSKPNELLLHDGRIINMYHRTRPIFLHANGKVVVPEELIDKELRAARPRRVQIKGDYCEH